MDPLRPVSAVEPIITKPYGIVKTIYPPFPILLTREVGAA